jgi:hypothetical protein
MLALLAFSDCNQLVASADDYFVKAPSSLSLFEKKLELEVLRFPKY